MASMQPLQPLHPDRSLSQAKLDELMKVSTELLIESLSPGRPAALKVRPEGTIVDGHHRIKILTERGVDCDSLPREVIEEL